MQDKFVNYWVHVAKRFANNKYVMGFDPLNEPSAPTESLFNYINRKLRKGVDDRTLLTPLYSRIQKEAYAIASKDSIMYFEPAGDFHNFKIFGYEIDGIVDAIGFKKPPGGEINSRNHAVNAHTYCC